MDTKSVPALDRRSSPSPPSSAPPLSPQNPIWACAVTAPPPAATPAGTTVPDAGVARARVDCELVKVDWCRAVCRACSCITRCCYYIYVYIYIDTHKSIYLSIYLSISLSLYIYIYMPRMVRYACSCIKRRARIDIGSPAPSSH